MQKMKRGNPEAEFPPKLRGPSVPPKVIGARGAAQINVKHLGGAFPGCNPRHNFFDCPCPGVVRRLLHVVMGDQEGFRMRQGVGSTIRP